MRRYLSPLRYPGGKARVAPYIASLIRAQPHRPTVYAEPFAGGAGAALRLLVDEIVRSVRINDLSPGVAAFWRSVFFNTEALASRVEQASVTMDDWHHARAVFTEPEGHDDADLGFATLFLNRCNRSGILTARPIGGMNQQGTWKIDARFNRTDLADRIRFLGQYRRRVHVSEQDGQAFVRDLEPLGQEAFVYVDPPYLVQGEDLYLDSLGYEDHSELAEALRASQLPWMLTYDVSETITRDLYAGMRAAEFSIAHTAQTQHVGAEYVIFSDRLSVTDLDLLAEANARWLAV